MARSEHPSIEELRALVLFANTDVVSNAAKELGISQPSTVKRLQIFHDMGLLRTRENNRVELTEKGQAVIAAARKLLRRYDDVKQFMNDKHNAPNVLRVATGSSGSQYYLPRAIARLRKRLPDWDVQTQVTRGEERILGTASGTFDMAIISHDRLQVETLAGASSSPAKLNVSELATQPLCVIARVDSPEADELRTVLAGHEVPLPMLCRWSIAGLDRRSGVRRQIERRFASSAERPQFSGEAGGWLAVKEYARHQLGVGLVPLAAMSREDGDDFVIRRLASDISIRYWMVRRPDSDNEAVNEMQSELLKAAQFHQQEVERRWAGHL